jgi:hypothetical protein
MSDHRLLLDILAQPDDSTCGPTCLHAVYRYHGEQLSLPEVIAQVGRLQSGGTLAVFLGSHALQQGYRARIYTFNLQVFDPTWFVAENIDLRAKLLAQLEVKHNARLHAATRAYIEFLDLGGELRMEVLTAGLIRKYLKRGVPILTGLSATFLYGEAREIALDPPQAGRTTAPDDVRGYPTGHFVVLCGYDPTRRTVLVADPLDSNPIAGDHQYAVDIDRVFASIMLGIVTYDANLLLIEPKSPQSRAAADARPRRR